MGTAGPKKPERNAAADVELVNRTSALVFSFISGFLCMIALFPISRPILTLT